MTKVTSSIEFNDIAVVDDSRTDGKTENFATNIEKITYGSEDLRLNKKPAMQNHAINTPAELGVSLTPNEIVMPGQYKLIGNNSEPLSYLCAYGAKDSVIISIYSSGRNKGGLYHINDTTQLARELKKFLKKMGCLQHTNDWTVTIVGGKYLDGFNFGLGTHIKNALQNQYQLTATWNRGSWFGFNAKMYGVLLNVQTFEQTDFEHTDKFVNHLNNDLMEQHRAQAEEYKKNSMFNTKSDNATPTFYHHAISNEKNKKITESNYFASVHYSITAQGVGARTSIDKFSYALEQCQNEMLPKPRKEQIAKIEEIHQQLNLQNFVELKIHKNASTNSMKTSSFSSRSTRFSQSISNSHSRDTFFSSSNITRSTAISIIKGNNKPFTIINSSVYSKQQQKCTELQNILAKKAINELASRRQHKSNHPMQESNFPPSVLAAFKNEFPESSLDKFYSRDLGDWEATGKGRGAWRMVSVRYKDNQLIIAGVFDNHKVPYRQW